MTPAPSTLPVTASERRAAELMRLRRVRRIPLLDSDRVVGLVTLDDLLLAGSVDLEELADIVEAQLELAAPLKPAGVVHPVRPARRPGHEARAEERLGRLWHLVQASTGLRRRELAETALEVVLSAIIRRITPQETEDLIAQLPSKLRERLLLLPRGPDKSIDLEAIASALGQRLDLGHDEAIRVARGVGAALKEVVSQGEIEDVRSQLPREMRSLFPT